MASKLRCRGCKDYFPREDLQNHFCSDECRAAHRSRQKPKKAPTYKKPTRNATFTPELKASVRERDGNCCRWCGAAGVPLECHHIIYRQAGGSELDAEWDLIALCQDHHREAHADVKRWQPILLFAVSTGLTVPEADGAYPGSLPDGPWAEHPHGRRWMLEVSQLSPANPQDAGDESLRIALDAA